MLSLVAALVLPSPALAHKPFFGPGYDSPDSALLLADPDVSIVLYREIRCESSQVWISFDAEPGYEAWVQLGVPEIERLADYRPSLAVVAPGLPAPEEELPFVLPEGTGAFVVHTAEVEEVGAFYEPFTQTSSWVLTEQLVTLPEGGPAWVVAWEPDGWTGKAWVAVGTVEDFSDVTVEDFASWSEQVHDFHETGRYEEPPAVTEVQCDLEADDAEAGLSAEDESSAGCAAAPVGAPLLFGPVAAALFARRRRGYASSEA